MHAFDHAKFTSCLLCTSQAQCHVLVFQSGSSSAGEVEQASTFFFSACFYPFIFFLKPILLLIRHVENAQESRWPWKSHLDEGSIANAYYHSHIPMSKKALITLKEHMMPCIPQKTDIQKARAFLIQTHYICV